ncbi:hypothetical protein BDAG_04895 [Burkholderia dolosa AU0158]|nr:hypothetical protein BDAG_04895 [Burkholderia dolosa AU0158]
MGARARIGCVARRCRRTEGGKSRAAASLRERRLRIECVIVTTRSFAMNDTTRAGHDTPTRDKEADPTPPLKDQDSARTRRSERHIDKQIEDTFPASDAPSTGGVTRIEPDTPPGTHDDGPWQDKRERRDE